jgi:4-amino-4-deoxy-L-arabinose transferase-like glycosyltransferase
MNKPHQSKRLFWGLFCMFCIVWLTTLGMRTLVPTDEGRYAEMAREMVASGDWVTTRLNGIKYFEKPPLQAWMNALTFTLFGLGEWQARLWTGVCGLLGIMLVTYTGQHVFNPRIGFYAGLVLASSFLWVALGHINTLDMGLAGMMTLALCGLLLGQRGQVSANTQRNWMLVCWAGMALSVLSKGLIGIVLPGAVLVLYTLVARDWNIWKRLHMGLGLLVFFAITVPWFILVSLKNPEFPHFFFIHEHFQRFTSKIHHRAGPWYYFIPILLLGSMPWLGVLAQSIWHARHDATEGFQPRKMLLGWAGFILFFFSISGSKLPSYILPIFPALALMIACYLEQASNKAIAFTAGLLAFGGAVGLGFVSRISTLTTIPYEIPLYQAYAPWVTATTVFVLIGSMTALALIRRHREWSIIVLAVTGFTSSQMMMLGHEPLGRYAAGLLHVPAIQSELTSQTPIYSVGRYEQALPFYLQRTLILVEHADEMEFGLQQEPQLWIPTRSAFVTQWRTKHEQGKKAIAILRPDIFTSFQQQGVPMHIIAQDPRRVIVSNDPILISTKTLP